MMPSGSFDVVIVGGGFYGARLALCCASDGSHACCSSSAKPSLLGRASLRNQARVHNGYHYPRSLLTSLRSRLNYARFLDEYAECVDRLVPALLRDRARHVEDHRGAVRRVLPAHRSAAERRAGGGARLFDATRIDAVFEVQECAFDAVEAARSRSTRELATAGVDVIAGDRSAPHLRRRADRRARHAATAGERTRRSTRASCSTARTRVSIDLLADSGAPIIPAKHELTEMALVEPPPELAGAAVTVMDGPFFSMMPYPSRGLFTLSHVRYTPHCSWHDRPGERDRRRGRSAPRARRRVHVTWCATPNGICRRCGVAATSIRSGK